MDAPSASGRHGHKKRKKTNALRQAKRYSKKGCYGRGFDLSEDSFQYLVRVLELSKNNFEGFETDEEKELFVNNSLSQMEGEEINYSSNQLGCRVVETLLPYAGDQVLLAFTTAFGQDLRPLVTDRFASHVLQKLVAVAGKRGTPAWDAWVLKVANFCTNNLEDFVWDTYGNHVVRTCLETLACLVEGGGARMEGRKEEAPPEFAEGVVEVARRLMLWPQFATLPNRTHTSGLLQTLLVALKATSKKTKNTLVKKLLDECFTQATDETEKYDKEGGYEGDVKHEARAEVKQEAGVEEGKQEVGAEVKVHDVFTNETSSRLLDVAISVASRKGLTQIYADCFAGRLVMLSQMSIANHQVQKLFEHCKEKVELESMYSEVSGSFENILQVKNSGVLLNLARACLRLATKQQPFQQQLMQALHCWDAAVQPHFALCVIQLEPFEPTRQGIKINLNGSLLLQTLLRFSKPIKVVESLLATSADDLVALLCDVRGSHVMDAYMSSPSVGEKSREKMLRHLRGRLVQLAQSRAGSRSLDAMWNVMGPTQRAHMLGELAPSEAQLNGNQYGKIVVAKYQLGLFRHRPEDWKELQGATNKKRKLFQDIIGGVEKK